MLNPAAPPPGRSPPSGSRPQPGSPAHRDGSNPNVIRTLRCRTVAQGRFQQLNYIRDLPAQPVIEHEPEGLLSETVAPNALESLLAALGSCLAVGIHANAVARNIPVRRLELELAAETDSTAGWGAGSGTPRPIGFEAIHVTVHLDADAPRDALSALIRHATLWSPAANTLHNPVHLDVALAEDTDPVTGG